MNRCTNCLSNNVVKVLNKNHAFYKCQNCGSSDTGIHQSNRQIVSINNDGFIQHTTIAAVIKKGDKYLFLNRKSFPYGMTMPSGHLEQGESINNALSREVQEETGLMVVKKKLLLHHTFYDKCKNGADFHEWYLFECTSSQNKVAINNESSDHIWVSKKDIPKLKLVPSVRYALFKAGIIEEVIQKPQPKKLEQKNKSNTRTNSIADNLPVPVLILDQKGKIHYENQAASKLLANLRDNKKEFNTFLKTLIDTTLSCIEAQSDTSRNFTHCSDTYNIVANPTTVSYGKPGAIITIKDITNEKQRETRDLLARETSLLLCSTSSYNNIIKTILKQTLYATDILGCSLMLKNEEILQVNFRLSKTENHKKKPLKLKIGEGVAGWVAKNKKLLIIPDTTNDPLYVGTPNTTEKSLLSLPVISNKEILGVLNFSREKNYHFSEEEVNTFSIIANRVALALENENLYRQLSNDKKTLETVLSTTSDGLILLSSDLKLIFANPAAIAINKLTKDEVKNGHIENFLKRTSPENIKRFLDAVNKSINHKKQVIVEFISKKGPNKIVRTVFNPIVEKDGKCSSVLIGFNNVTKTKLRQQQIQNKIQQITALFKISSVSHNTTSRLIDSILQKTEEIFGSVETGIFLFDRGLLPDLATNGEVKKIINSNKSLLAKSKLGVIFNDAKKELGSKNICRIALIPIKPNKEILGYLYVISKKTRFSSEDSKILNIIASRIALRMESDDLIKQLENDQRKLQNIIDNTADGIIAMDAKGNQLLWNKSMTQLTGFAEMNEYFKKNSEREMKIQSLFKVANKETGDMEYSDRVKIKNSDDQETWVDASYSVVKNIEGGSEYIIGVLRDASREVDMENKQKEFIYTTTHELRTPITAVKGYLSMIMHGDAGEVTDKQKLFFSRAYSSTERLVGLVEDLLQVARLEENRMHFETEEFSANKLMHEVANDFTHKALDKGLHIRTSQKGKLSLYGDYNLTKQALSNLLDNAIKYTKKGNIQISIDKAKGFGYISIVDFGVGIPKKEQSAIFDKFHRVFNSESVKAGGTGLGLFIVKNLIEKQGGQVSLESKLGQGSTFKISLPLAKK